MNIQKIKQIIDDFRCFDLNNKDIYLKILNYIKEASFYKSGHMTLEYSNDLLTYYYSTNIEVKVENGENKYTKAHDFLYVIDCKDIHNRKFTGEETKHIELSIFLTVIARIFEIDMGRKCKLINFKNMHYNDLIAENG